MKSQNGIIRAQHNKDNPYVLVLRQSMQDRTLTFEARGLLGYLLSKPDDWQIIIGDLEQECGSAKVYRILKELIDAGYVVRTYHRDDKGRIVSVEYVAYESPFLKNQEMANQEMAKPFMANPPLHNTDTNKVEKTQRKRRKTKTKAEPIQLPNEVETIYAKTITLVVSDSHAKLLQKAIDKYTLSCVMDGFAILQEKIDSGLIIDNKMSYLMGIIARIEPPTPATPKKLTWSSGEEYL